MVSAGSTGALLTGATLTVKRIRGIRRAALAPVLPTGQYGTVLIDCGANAECSPEYLLQFAYMGSFYSEKVLGCPRPRVGLLNIGTEEEKGMPCATRHMRCWKKQAGKGASALSATSKQPASTTAAAKWQSATALPET